MDISVTFYIIEVFFKHITLLLQKIFCYGTRVERPAATAEVDENENAKGGKLLES